MLITVGCTTFQYGYDSDVYKKKLVLVSSEMGKRRIRQIEGYDAAARALLSVGYKPDYLYEVTEDDFYFISATASYHLKRSWLDVDSSIDRLESLPFFITDQMEKYGIEVERVPIESDPKWYVKRARQQKNPFLQNTTCKNCGKSLRSLAPTFARIA